ncbi:hypothetical protein B0O80DRAFT_281166 [Mortierella sp. GBAus27b]|nr:hypothetical protein B0O80DRAFT_281166 [Mortierella sp. GBAus27b]
MAIVSPFEIPEIATVVGHYLTHRDLIRCLTVSKSWHATFLPLVWSTVPLDDQQPPLTLDTLSRHCHLIKDLTYNTTIWRHYESILCTNLTTLHVNHDKTSSRIKLAQYDKLKHLSLYSTASQIPYWTLQCGQIKNLSTLELTDIGVTSMGATPNFWNFCTRLRALTMTNVYILDRQDKSLIFKHLESIKVEGSYGIDSFGWIVQCPKLVSFSWKGLTSDWFDAFAEHLEQGSWPKLNSLGINGMSEEQLVRILEGMDTVVSITQHTGYLGQPSCSALHRHLHGLRVLDIGSYMARDPRTDGSVMNEILTSCPRLEDITLGIVYSQDIIDGGPWACHSSLKYFSARIMRSAGGDTTQHLRKVAERISQLTNLERLHLGDPLTFGTDLLQDLRLGNGLELFVTLKKLRIFDVKSSLRYMTLDDVEWMINTWKNLTTMRCEWSPSIGVIEMLSAAGIRYENTCIKPGHHVGKRFAIFPDH